MQFRSAFIDTHQDKPLVGRLGKLQIALEISRAESRSDLRVSDENIRNRLNFDGSDVSKSWLVPFTKILLDGCRATNLADIGSGLTIICFNYDRCIEHCLCAAVSAAMDVSEEQAHEVVYAMDILHPYGHLGNLPRSRHQVLNNEVAFGALNNPWAAVERIRTYTEEMTERESLSRIRHAVSHAEQVLFLGFSFAPQNMKLLEPDETVAGFREIKFFTTGVGLHAVAHDEIKQRMLNLAGSSSPYSKATVMPEMTCAQAMTALTPILADPSPNIIR